MYRAQPQASAALLRLLLFWLAACAQDPLTPAPPGGSGENPVVLENRKEGDPSWLDRKLPPAGAGEIEAYADAVSDQAGASVGIHASASPPGRVRWVLRRLGWYGGARARRVAEGDAGRIETQAACPPEKGSGLVRCDWKRSFSVELPRDAVSGLYLLELIREEASYALVPLVVTDGRRADLLFQASVTTWQAYNDWGGTSFYVDRRGGTSLGRAVKVGFDRPYAEDYGSGQMLRYEALFASFLERYGYDVRYTTNLDAEGGALAGLVPGQAFLSVGHDEYWTGAQRDTLEAARDRGVSLLFFSANTGYWKFRWESDSPAGRRTLVSYKGDAGLDPEQGPERSGLFRSPALGRPENALLGVMYDSWSHVSGAWVVADETHFLFRGTGLKNGDTIASLVGYEYDRSFDNGHQPEGLRIAARSPMVDIAGQPALSETASYRAKSGALVFASGTIEWSYGLGKEGVADPRVERMTANVFAEAIGLPVPSAVGADTAPPALHFEGPKAKGVETVATGFASPAGVAVDAKGRLYVADPGSHQILRVAPGGSRQVLAGDGSEGSTPAFDGVAGRKARFFGPTSLLLVGQRLIVADTKNHCLRIVDLASPDHAVRTLAGKLGEAGMHDGPAEDARFRLPQGLALDPRRGTIIVADAGNGRLREVDPATGATRTLVGGGAQPSDGPGAATALAWPSAVAVAEDGTVYVVDTLYGQIRAVAPDASRTVTTLVTGPLGPPADGTGANARLAAQGGAVWDGRALLVAEPAGLRIRRIHPGASAAKTVVETFAGGRAGAADGSGEDAGFSLPMGLAVGPDGSIYVADAGAGSIRRLW